VTPEPEESVELLKRRFASRKEALDHAVAIVGRTRDFADLREILRFTAEHANESLTDEGLAEPPAEPLDHATALKLMRVVQSARNNFLVISGSHADGDVRATAAKYAKMAGELYRRIGLRGIPAKH
jgi:hypothetical protein